MKRTFIALLLAAVLILPALASPGSENFLPDAKISQWAVEEIKDAYAKGLVSPEFDLGGDYTADITRGQFARIAVDMAAAEQGKTIDELLTEYDVMLSGEEHPLENEPMEGDPLDGGLPPVENGSFADTHSVYIELAHKMGIIYGYDGLFRPDEAILRMEAALIVQRTMGALSVTEADTAPKPFNDAYEIPAWAREAVKFASGRTDGSGRPVMGGADSWFRPQDLISIEESILVIRRIHESLAVTGVCGGWRDMERYELVDLALTFGGDCTLGRGHYFPYKDSFDEMYDLKNDPSYFFSGIPHFFDDDLTMVNFEGTLTESTRRAYKTFNFKGPAKYAEILRAGSVDVVTIANNHSMDYLQKGFDDTINNLTPYVAISGYERMPIVTVKGVRIGFASNVGWDFGSSQRSFIENAVSSLRAQGADIVVFNYHWGIERTYRSNSTQRSIAHYCIDQGADLVIGHHPHVPQEVEIYNGKPIAYSLGNLVFGGNTNPSEKNCLIFRQNYTFNLDTRQLEASSYEALPYRVSSVDYRNDYHPVPRAA